MPPALSPAEREFISGQRSPLTVGVARHSANAYSDSLLDALRATDLFERVAPLDEFETPPDLVADVNAGWHGSGGIPMLTLLSCGLIPCHQDEGWGFEFWLSPRSAPADRRYVEYIHHGTTTLGLIALFDVFSSDRTIAPWSPKSSRRMTEQLSLAILVDAPPHERFEKRPPTR